MIVREAVDADRDHVLNVYRSAFPEREAEPVAKLAVDLLAEETTPPVLSLIAELDGRIVGHVAFSPVTIEHESDTRAYILAPLGVHEDVQRRGVGSQLVQRGLDRLAESGVSLVFVYGDPAYYGRFGFEAETAVNYEPPYELQYPFGWQVRSQFPDSRIVPVRVHCVEPLSDPTLW